jgi:ribosomal protein S18 acetylase RimI-like enzyme
MSGIIYRDIQDGDFEKIVGLIQETWRFENKIADFETRQRFIHALLSSTLLTSSWGHVAVKDGKLVGFILGLAKTDKRRLRKVSQAKGLIRDILSLLLAKQPDKRGLQEYLKVPRAYREMKKGRSFPAEITFLAVADACQGFGIGKQLMNDLMNYFDSLKVGYIAVFTDSDSNYGFYDHQGFTLLDQREISLTTTQPVKKQTIFLYGYEPGKQKN